MLLIIFVVLFVILSPFSDVGSRTACSVQQQDGGVFAFLIMPKVAFVLFA